jgi:hypothetical protein
LVADGTNIKWYANAVGGESLAPATALVSGNYYFASQTVGNVESVERLFVIPSVANCTGIKENAEKYSYYIKNNEIQLISSNNKATRAILYDLQGRTVKMTNLNEGNSISISGLKSGVYFLKIKANSGIQTIKILIPN